MKVKYQNMIQSYRGKKDGLVYYYHPGLESCIAREYVKPRATENNRRMKAVTQNLQALNPAQGYRDDLKVYIKLLKSHPDTEHAFHGHYWSLYLKIMWRMAKMPVEQLSKAAGVVGQDADHAGEGNNPRISSIGMLLYIDLESITREFIYANDLPCISVKKAVEAGLLVPVSGYELLTRLL